MSDSVNDLKYLTRMIDKGCGDALTEIHCHAVKEVIKDESQSDSLISELTSKSDAAASRNRKDVYGIGL